jgi:Dolichyl-phosphate-mannose-protein mannosyltransferase
MVEAAGVWPRIDRRELFALGALLVLGALLLGRHLATPSLEFDEGVYVGSADLLGHGMQLGRDVFSSQPPLFFALLDATQRAGGGSLTVFHGMTVAIALAGALAGWALVRGIAGPFPALVAAAMVVLAPGVVDAAAVVSADVPSVALGTGALLAARASRHRAIWGAAAGVLICCALLVKLLAVPFAVALAVTAIVDRPPRRALIWFAAGSAAVLAAVGIAYASVLGDLWREAVGLHLHARESAVVLPHPSIAGQVALIVTGYVGILAILVVGLRHIPRDEFAGWARLRLDLLITLAAGLLLTAVNRPLLHHHLVILAWPLALVAASTLPTRLPVRAVAIAVLGCLLLVPWAVRGRDTVQGAESDRIDAAAAVVRSSTGPGETVVSDLPLVPLAAGRQSAAATADPSAVRIGTGSLTREQILAAADSSSATVVGRSFALVPGLGPELKRRYSRVVDVDGIRVYVDPRT